MATFALPHSRWSVSQAALCVQAWHDALTACGWAQTEDTGQVTIAEAEAKTAVGQIGQRMYVSTDPLTAELPIYLKLGFSITTHGAFTGALVTYIQVGLATDGANTIMGSSSFIYGMASAASYPQTTASGALASLLASGDGGSLRVCDLPGYFAYTTSDPNRHVSSAGTFIIARTKDADGNPTAEGVVLASPVQYISNFYVHFGTTTIKPIGVTVERAHRLTPILLEAGDLPGQVSTVDGQMQMQHPWACTPRLYPFEDLGFLTNYSSAAIGDILNIQQGSATKKYIFIGRTGYCPAVPGSTTYSATSTASMYMEAGFAMLWE